MLHTFHSACDLQDSALSSPLFHFHLSVHVKMSSKHGFLGSSPSSDGGGTANGTPETRLTPFSSVKSINDKTTFLFNPTASNAASIKATMSQHGTDPMDKDPFITTGIKTSGEQSVLSPTASAFQPFSVLISQAIDNTPVVVNSQSHAAALRAAKQSMLAPLAPSNTEPVSPMGSQSPALTQSGSFSTDLGSITRALKVSGIYHQAQAALIQAAVQVCHYFLSSQMHCPNPNIYLCVIQADLSHSFQCTEMYELDCVCTLPVAMFSSLQT